MPDINDYGNVNMDSGFGALATATPQQYQQAAQATGPGDSHAWYTTLAGDTIGGALDLADTVASSTIGRFTGMQRGDLNNKVLGALDMPGLTNFFNQNQGGIGVASTIEGIAASAYAGGKIAKVAMPLLDVFKSAPIAGRLLTLEDSYQAAMGTVRAVDTQLAASGVTGSEAWATSLTIPAVSADAATGATASGFLTTTRAQAVTRAMGLSFGKGVVHAAGQEAVMATFLNQNDYLYSEDAGQNLMWMGLGLATGGVFNVLGTGYQIRKFANSDMLQRLKAEALDPLGQEKARTSVPDADPAKSNLTFLGSLQGTTTDRVTSYMVSAKAKPAMGVDPKTFARLAIQHEDVALNTELIKATVKGIPGQVGTGFDSKAAGWWNHVTKGLDSDPALLYGTESIGGIADDATLGGTHAAVKEETQNKLASLKAALDAHDSGEATLSRKGLANTLTALKNTRFFDGLTPMAIIDREPVPLSIGAAYDNFARPTIKVDSELGMYEAFHADGRSTNVGIDNTGKMYLPGDKTMETADHFDVLRLYDSAHTQLRDLAKQTGDSNFVWSIPEQADGSTHWLHLDMAEQLMKDTNGRANVDWGRFTPESAKKESLIQKIIALKGTDFVGMDPADMQKLRVRFNLPRLNSYQMGVLGTMDSPLDVLIRGSVDMPESQLRNMSVGDFKQAFASMNNIGDLATQDASQVKSFMGNSFNFMRDDQGNPLKPLLMYKRNIAPQDFAPDTLAERIGAKKTAIAAQLTGGQSGPMTREIIGNMLANPDFEAGAYVSGLHDTQIASSIPGLANIPSQTGIGAILNSLTTAEWRARDNPAILALTRLREGVDRRMLGFYQDTAKAAMGDSIATINGPRNVASKTLLDNFHTFRPGWDLEEKTIRVPGANGEVNGFVLSDTVGNKQRFLQQYGREMNAGEVLLDSKGNQVVMDDLALDTQKRFNMMSDAHRVEKNSLLAARGLPEITRDSWYVPPQDVTGKYIGFTRDINGNTLPGGTIIANSTLR